MEPDLNISLEGFSTEEEANIIGNLVINATKTLSESLNLNISKLKAIVIAYDFATALQRVTSAYNHTLPSSFTNSKQGMAVGQLVSKMSSNGLCDEYTLVLSVNFFNGLFNDEGKVVVNDIGVKEVIHLIHHELVHVHEKNTLTCLDQSVWVNEYGGALLIPATRAWSEYLANFMSSKSAPPQTINNFLENLQIVINEVPNEIDEFVLNYSTGVIPLNAMFLEVKKRVKLIINSYGYAIGYVHALNIDLDVSFPELATELSNSKLKYPLTNLSKAFEKLIEKYKNNEIESYDDFYEISEAIDSIFKVFGLTLKCVDWYTAESELYIDVN
ncbi:TPA: hypothetical protein ACGEGE_000538 [Yersinia enterocolitica]|uniref:hypothetical protein n=1 Tax=Yersinia enterocolitica TaxID=630 RepID=UPI0021551776|nr:hypothetical protein [Yersinia enterocolitica]